MNIMKKIFKEKPKPPQDVTRLGRVVANKIDNLVLDVFNTHQGRICFEPPGFIVPAVWGASEHGDLSPVQVEIFRKVNPAIDAIILSMGFRKLEEDQAYTLGLMLRWIIISKITHMAEIRKKGRMGSIQATSNTAYPLDSMEPMGSC